LTARREGDPVPPLPEGFGVSIDGSTLILRGGRTVLGGSPRRLLRLSPAAAGRLLSWRAGTRPTTASERQLARTLTDAGIAHPQPVGGPKEGDITFVIPVRDRHRGLARCLAALPRGVATVVVDDGSIDPEAIAAAARAHGAELVRIGVPCGPAGARNAGLARCATEIAVFVDSDCVVEPNWLEHLLPHFADPLVGAVAPRIGSLEQGSNARLARYEAVRSPLDLGSSPGWVAPQTRISYVPAAALAVRRAAAGTGFAPDLRVGEDVDFVWRLHEAGWRVRYEPEAKVAHEHRTVFAAWLRRRFEYGRSAASLASRHPGRLAPAVLSPWAAVAWTLLLLARPRAAAAVVVASGVRLRQRLDGTLGRNRVAGRVTASVTLGSGRGLADAVTRAWLPPAAIAALRVPVFRRAVLAAWLIPAEVEWVRRRPNLDPFGYAALRLLDDGGYCCGVWVGCVQQRTLDPLLPQRWRIGASDSTARGAGGPSSKPCQTSQNSTGRSSTS
jgi:mycofactocin glycosyltransferase